MTNVIRGAGRDLMIGKNTDLDVVIPGVFNFLQGWILLQKLFRDRHAEEPFGESELRLMV